MVHLTIDFEVNFLKGFIPNPKLNLCPCYSIDAVQVDNTV